MSVSLNVNGSTFNYPQTGDQNWGPDATNWAIAVTNGMLQKAGGLFQLLSEVDFGSSYGIKSLYFSSRSTDIADAGILRLSNTDAVAFRNFANDGNLLLGVDASDNLTFNGTSFQGSISVADTATIDLDFTANVLTANIVAASITNAMISASAAIVYSKLSLTNSITNADIFSAAGIEYSKLSLANAIVNGDISGSAAIARSKLAAGTINQVVINDGSGNFSSEAQLAKVRGGSGQDNTNITFPSLGTLATLAGVEVFTNKTLTSPVLNTPRIDVATLDGQASTPSNPSAGDYKLFVSDTTQKLSLLNSAGVVTTVGAGGGTVNWVSNGDAEAGTTGWATYADAAGTAPVNGTGGSPTVTITTSSTAPLSGTSSFIFTKTAVNSQGQGWSYDFSVDSANLAKVQQVAFNYLVNSGTFNAGAYPNTLSDVTVWVYDVTNSQLIQPSGYILTSNSTTISGNVTCEFQTNSNSTSYRLIFHVSGTNASAFTLKVDNVVVAPCIYVYGSPVLDVQNYTPTFNGGAAPANSGIVGRYSKVGDKIVVTGALKFTGTPGAYTTFFVGLPPGLSIDTSKLPNIDQDGMVLGIANSFDTGVAIYPGAVLYNSTTAVEVTTFRTNTGANPVNVGSYYTNNTLPFSMGNLDVVTWEFEVPITGWSSSVLMSDAASTRVIAFRASNSASTVYGGTATVQVPFTNVEYDTAGAVSGNSYIIPVSGKYRVSALIVGTTQVGAVNGYMNLQLNVNGSAVTTFGKKVYETANATNKDISGETTYNFIAGQVVTISLENQSGTTFSAIGVSQQNWVSIERLSGPSAIAASDSVNCAYTKSGAQSMPSGTATSILYDTKISDSHNAYNVSTGIYTVPVSGTYYIEGGLSFSVASTSVSVFFVLRVAQTGSASRNREFIVTAQSTAANTFIPNGSTLLPCMAGDQIAIQFINGNGTANCDTQPTRNFMSIARVGN